MGIPHGIVIGSGSSSVVNNTSRNERSAFIAHAAPPQEKRQLGDRGDDTNQDAMRAKANHAHTIRVADVLKGNLADNPEWSWASAPATIARLSRAYENVVEAEATFAKQMQTHNFNDLKKTAR